MMHFMLYTFSLITSMIFMNMNHPLAMGLMLLIQTTIIALMTGLMSKSFWFSYILFLIFVGGMLVLFLYVTTIASNEMFSLSYKLLTLCFLMIYFTIIILFLIDNSYILHIFENNEMSSLFNLNNFNKENTLILNKLYNYPTHFLTLFLMNYLLITLIAVVKITNMFYGPLRPMN